MKVVRFTVPKKLRRWNVYILSTSQTLFERRGKGSFTLHPSDPNAAKILVHPDTFAISELVHWEDVKKCSMPRLTGKPRSILSFLHYMEPEEEESPSTNLTK